MNKTGILFDIGGSKMRIALSRDGISFGEPRILATPAKYEDGRDLFLSTARELVGQEKIGVLVGGIAGPFDENKRSLVGSPNLTDWVGKPFKTEVEKELQVNMHIENDSAMVGLGEAIFGAGRGYKIVAYITVSTGVGGARIVGGEIDEKSIGFEPGHQIIDASRALESTEPNTYLGDILSGNSLEKRFGKKPKDLMDPELWEKMSKYLAYALNNVCVFWSPDCIVLGGSMITGSPAIPVDKTRDHLQKIVKIFPDIPVINKSELGDIGGLYGSLAYMRNLK
jgi:predicted NBD/HSP70 family sugar kinase